MSLATYSEYQDQVSSEKVGLVVLEAAKRFVGWELYSGSVYRVAFTYPAIASVRDSATSLTAGSSASLSAGQYYYDRAGGYLYVRTSDSVDPSTKFLSVTFKLFFSNRPTGAPHDLSTGYEVNWLPTYLPGGSFKTELDNQNLLGFAIEGSGTVVLKNDQEFWQPLFDKVYFENQLLKVYSWNPELPITEAKLLFRGRVQKKTYSGSQVSFECKDQLNELRAPIPLSNMEDYSGALIPPSLNTAKQRLLYGYVKGHVPTNIDQELELTGYTITGTATPTNGVNTVTGTGTSFLAQLTEGDEILFGSDTTWYTVEEVSTDTAITLTETYSGVGGSAVAIRIKSGHPKRYMNRVHLIAGHELREPTSTVTACISLRCLDLADATDFLSGEFAMVNGEVLEIERLSGNRVTFTTEMAVEAAVGTTVTVLSVKNVYLNQRLLTYSRDYTYNAETAKITLNSLAEFNVAPIRQITGTLSFSSASRTVTGTGTIFTSEVKPGDWLRRQGQDTWVEVLKVDSNTSLIVRSLPAYTSSGYSDLRKPEVYKTGEVVLSLDVLGATENGQSTGTFLKTAAQVVRDILVRLDLEDQLNEDSFDEAAEIADEKIGFAYPERFADTKPKSARDVINLINGSVLGSLFQNADFELAYSILSPERPSDMLRLAESDVMAPSLSSDGSRIVSTSRVRYLKKEHDPASKGPSTSEATKVSDEGQYLALTEKEHLAETVLIEHGSAETMANRLAFLFQFATSVFKFRTGMQGARLSVNDKVDISHEKLYERVGSVSKRKIAAVQSVSKGVNGVAVELSDLSNGFSRCSTITDDDAADHEDADEDELLYNGYITDDNGLVDDDPASFGCNLIW